MVKIASHALGEASKLYETGFPSITAWTIERADGTGN
jgi:hypothetical protein